MLRCQFIISEKRLWNCFFGVEQGIEAAVHEDVDFRKQQINKMLVSHVLAVSRSACVVGSFAPDLNNTYKPSKEF